MLANLRYLLWIELVLRLRHAQEWLYPLTFILILVILFPLTFTADANFLQEYLPGYLWLVALLGSLLSMPHFFFREKEAEHLEQLLFAAIPLPLLLSIKIMAQWLTMILPLMIFIPVIGILFHLSAYIIFILWISLILGTPIFILLGCLGAALTLGLREGGVLLAILILPLVIPVLIFGINIVKEAQFGLSIRVDCALLTALTVLSITLLPFAIAKVIEFSVFD